MAIFNSYVKLPEGIHLSPLLGLVLSISNSTAQIID